MVFLVKARFSSPRLSLEMTSSRILFSINRYGVCISLANKAVEMQGRKDFRRTLSLSLGR